MAKARRTKIKALLSGRSARITFYENDIFYGLESLKRKKIKEKTQQTKQTQQTKTTKQTKTVQGNTETRRRAGRRAKATVFNLISTNAWFWFKENNEAYLPVFLTLTHKENFTDIKDSNALHTKFIKDLNYYIFHTTKVKIRYLSVIEFQKRGAVHYHIIFFNVPYIKKKEYADIWQHGFVHVRKVDEQENVAKYLTKYLSKDNNDVRLQNKKRYSCSRGLLKPIAVTIQEEALALYQKIPKEYIVGKKEIINDFLGKITTISYDFGKGTTANDIIG
jgi:hypothetical protein